MIDVVMWIVTIEAYWSQMDAPIPTLLVVIIGMLYWNVRRARDFYIVRRIGYARTYSESHTPSGKFSVLAGRGKIEYNNFDVFEDFAAARASFDYLHTLFPGDMWQEWEMSMFAVRTFSPGLAMRRIKAQKYPDRPLAATPYNQTIQNRDGWEKARKQFLENEWAENEDVRSRSTAG